MKLLRQLSIILSIAFTGELIEYIFNPPIPSNVISMLILLILLTRGIIKINMIDKVTKFLLDHLAVFFIPPGVSLINNFELLKREWLAIITIVVVSTVVIIVVTGLTIQFIKRRGLL